MVRGKSLKLGMGRRLGRLRPYVLHLHLQEVVIVQVVDLDVLKSHGAASPNLVAEVQDDELEVLMSKGVHRVSLVVPPPPRAGDRIFSRVILSLFGVRR